MLPPSSPLSCALSPQEVHTEALRHGLRRYRAGPDHAGFSRLHRFLRDHGLGVALAADRKLWDQWRDMWLFAFQVQHQTIGHNIYCVKESQMAWHVRCWQECALVVRQSLLDMVRPQLLASTCIYKFVVWTLDRVDGWQGVHVQCSASCTFDDVVGLFLGVSGFFY
jgi:hypothetical protein